MKLLLLSLGIVFLGAAHAGPTPGAVNSPADKRPIVQVDPPRIPLPTKYLVDPPKESSGAKAKESELVDPPKEEKVNAELVDPVPEETGEFVAKLPSILVDPKREEFTMTSELVDPPKQVEVSSELVDPPSKGNTDAKLVDPPREGKVPSKELVDPLPPRTIAVGEPNGKKKADFSVDGYLYEGTEKVGAYRIDFHGVHYRKPSESAAGRYVTIKPNLPVIFNTKEEKDVGGKRQTPGGNGEESVKSTAVPAVEETPAVEKEVTPVSCPEDRVSTVKPVDRATATPAIDDPASTSRPAVTAIDPQDAVSTAQPVVKDTVTPAIDTEEIGSTSKPVVKDTVTPIIDPVFPKSTSKPVDRDTATPAIDPTDALSSSPAPVFRASTVEVDPPVSSAQPDVKTTASPASSIESLFTGVPPKPEFGHGKCTKSLVFAYDAKAGECLAKGTQVCDEKQWEAVKAQSYAVCMKNAPKRTSTTPVDKPACGLGKVYVKVPGEPSADLYGKLCKDDFCPKDITCVQQKTKAHCCILVV